MAKIIMIAGTAIVVFGLSAVGSWFLNKSGEAAVVEEEGDTNLIENAVIGDGKLTPGDTDPSVAGGSKPSDELKIPEPLPPFDIQEVPITELLEHYEQLAVRNKQLDERAAQLKEKEQHLKQMEKAIKMSEDKLNKMMQQTREIQEETVLVLEEADQKMINAQSIQQEIADADAAEAPEKSAALLKNAKDWARTLEGLEPAKAAEIIKDLANEYGVPAIKPLIDAITKRKAAEIVGELQTLDNTITKKLFGIPMEEEPTKE